MSDPRYVVEECISAEQAQDKLNQYERNGYEFMHMTTGRLGDGFGAKNFILLTFRRKDPQAPREALRKDYPQGKR